MGILIEHLQLKANLGVYWLIENVRKKCMNLTIIFIQLQNVIIIIIKIQ